MTETPEAPKVGTIPVDQFGVPLYYNYERLSAEVKASRAKKATPRQRAERRSTIK